jgi:hypothetical protein
VNRDYGFSWRVTFINSDWWLGYKFYDVPQLMLSNRDGTYAEDFTSSVNSNIASSTLVGNNAVVTSTNAVLAMNGYEQQSIHIEVFHKWVVILVRFQPR